VLLTLLSLSKHIYLKRKLFILTIVLVPLYSGAQKNLNDTAKNPNDSARPEKHNQAVIRKGFYLKIINKDSATDKGFHVPDYERAFVTPKERSAELQKVLFTCYDESYLTATFDSILQDSINLTAWLTPGKPYKWACLKKGNVEELPLNFSGYREMLFLNKPFYYKTAAKLMNKILTYYENNGYPFARIRLDSINLTNNNFSATLKVDKKSVEKIDSIVVIGNLKISKSFLYGYLGIKPGDFYDESKVKVISARLKALPFLYETRPLQIAFIQDKVKILLYLGKKSADQFNGIIGILPSSTGKTVITGDINLGLQNSFHRAEELSFNWQHLQPLTEDLNIHFSYPYLFNTPVGFDEDFKLHKQDTTYLQLDEKVGFRYLLIGGDYIKAYYEDISTSLLSTYGIQDLTASDVSTGLYGLEYKVNRLDYIYNPRSGFEMLVSAAAGDKTIHENANLTPQDYAGLQLNSLEYRGNIDAAYYLPVAGRAAFKVGLNGGYINSQSLLLNDLYRIGGFSILRGFDEQSIYASQYAVGTLEFHYLLEQNSFMFLFFDQGWCKETLTNEIQFFNDTPYGFGAGMNFQTKAGIFSIAYALGNDKQVPLNFSSGKINFGIVNYF
jgi:outer membrane protein assembly factor BamA